MTKIKEEVRDVRWFDKERDRFWIKDYIPWKGAIADWDKRGKNG